MKQAESHGINPSTVTNFKGKEILDCLHALKIEYDPQYFSRQTYREFLVDPLGAKLIDAWASADPTVIKNTNESERLFRLMQKVAHESPFQINLAAPSRKKQAEMAEEEEQRRNTEMMYRSIQANSQMRSKEGNNKF